MDLPQLWDLMGVEGAAEEEEEEALALVGEEEEEEEGVPLFFERVSAASLGRRGALVEPVLGNSNHQSALAAKARKQGKEGG